MKNWKERFEKEWRDVWETGTTMDGDSVEVDREAVKSFIEQVEKEAIEGERERIQEIIGEHNARILNEYQHHQLGDERVLFSPIEKATQETISLLSQQDKV